VFGRRAHTSIVGKQGPQPSLKDVECVAQVPSGATDFWVRRWFDPRVLPSEGANNFMREGSASMHHVKELFFSTYSVLSVCCILAGFLLSVSRDYLRQTDAPLQTHLGRAIAAGAIPSGLALICVAFDPASLTTVPGLELPITLGALALLYISCRELVR
jgi:hypothetical protein